MRPTDTSDTDRAVSTRTTEVYEQLRQAIVRGELLPGEKLRIEALGQRFDVGSSPLREALNRLSSEGLVMQREQRGFTVSPVSRDELLELTRTRCWVNEIVLRESIAHGDTAWEEAVVLAFHRLSRTPARTAGVVDAPGAMDASGAADATGAPNPAWSQTHQAFHAALIAACPSRWLIDFSNMLHDCADRYRNLNAVANTGVRDVPGEHRAIFEATVERNAERAIRLLNEHLTITTTTLLANAHGVLAERLAAKQPDGAGRKRPEPRTTRIGAP